MASNPIERATREGTTFKIVWRERGKSGQQGRSFHSREKALLFKRLVELGGRGNNVCPSDEELIRYGLVTAAEIAIAAGGVVEPVMGVVTVGQAMEMYLAYLESQAEHPSDRTMREYRSLVKNYLAGTELADADVAAVMPKAINAWKASQARRPRRDGRKDQLVVSNNSLNKAMTTLSSMFSWSTMTVSDPTAAGETPLRMRSSPMTEVKRLSLPPKNEDDEKGVLENVSEYQTFIECAYLLDPYWADMAVTTAFSAARFGEITALTAGQVDFKKNRIYLDRRFSAGKLVMGLKGSKPGAPITRYTRLPTQIMELLGARCEGRPKNALVFPGPRFGFSGRWAPSVEGRRWADLNPQLESFGINRDLHHHNLRHSYVTYLQNHGFSESIAGQAVGHSVGKKTITRRYTHVTEELWMKILDEWEPMLGGLMEIRAVAYEHFDRRFTV